MLCRSFTEYSYFWAGVNDEYGPLGFFFTSSPSLSAARTFALAEVIVIDGISSLKGPEGSGKSCFCFTGRKYFKMDILHLMVPGWSLRTSKFFIWILEHCTKFKDEFGGVKYWQMPFNSPKFSPAKILHYTV